MTKSVFLLLAPLALAACVGNTTESGDDGALADELVERTIVTISADGTPTSRVVTVTRAEVLREVEERAHIAEAAARDDAAGSEALGTAQQATTLADDSCLNSSIWVYDVTAGPNCLANSGASDCPWKKPGYHEICFKTDNTAAWGVSLQSYYRELRVYPLPPLTWKYATRSYWPGTNAGYFLTDKVEFGVESFSSWGPLTNAGYYAQTSYFLGLDQ
jgi:hypothetical protein